MLFVVLYKPTANITEADQKRGLQLFTQWTPPFEFKAHYARGDGKGGVAIVESDSAEAVVEGTSPWLPYFEFEVTPAVEIQAAVPLFMRSYEWRDSVS